MQKFFLLLTLIISTSASAQTVVFKTCATDSMFEIQVKKDPAILFRRQQLKQFAKQFIGEDQRVTASNGILYTIPVVFHVIHNYGSENISKQQILDGMDVLNKSFQKMNDDTSDVIPLFQPIFADVQVQFRLATIDPNGNCTDGITRTKSTLTYSANDNVKSLIGWDSDKYLNIWVVQNIASGAAGYAYYPGVSSAIDGIEILSNYVIGQVGGNYVSRSLTHEVGHYLDLPHTWGSTNFPGLASNCFIDDGIFDTPNTAGTASTSICNTAQNTCGFIDNVQNYMDYAACHKMFTEGQKAVMHATLNSGVGSRDNLSMVSNLIATGTEDGHVAALCVPKADFSDKSIAVCEGTTLTFADKSWQGDATNWQWDFAGGTPSFSFAQNPSIQYNTPGTYDVRLIVSNSAGSDTLLRQVYLNVLSDTGNTTIPYSEDFETIGIPSTDWGVENTGSTNSFGITNTAALSGSKSVRLLNFAGNASGSVDALITPGYDLSNVQGAVFSFKYAFATKNSSDSSFLKILVSSDCGQTWTQRLLKSSSSLQTAPLTTSNFTPLSSQWVNQNVSLVSSQFSGKPSVRIKFEYTQDRGNNLYIDDINLNGIVGINEILTDKYGFGIYPNPTQQTAILKMELQERSNVMIELYNMVGMKLLTIADGFYQAGKQQFEVINNNYEGVYLIRTGINNNTFTQKIVFVK